MSKTVNVLVDEKGLDWPNSCARCGALEGLRAVQAVIAATESVRPNLSGRVTVRSNVLRVAYPACEKHAAGLGFAQWVTRKSWAPTFMRWCAYLFGPLALFSFVVWVSGSVISLFGDKGEARGRAELPVEFIAIFALSALWLLVVIWCFRVLPLRLVELDGDLVTINFRSDKYATEFERANGGNRSGNEEYGSAGEMPDWQPELLVRARRMLWVAVTLAVISTLALLANKAGPFVFFWILSSLAGIDGMKRAVKALNTEPAIKALNFVAGVCPVINLAPIAYFLWRAQSAPAQAGGETRIAGARARAQARQRTAVVKAPAPSAQPASAQAGGQPSAQARPIGDDSKARLARAIAYVKGAGLPNMPEGAILSMKITGPGVEMSEPDQPVVRASKGVFAVFYALDEGDQFTFVTRGQLDAAGMTTDELHAIGMRNLAALANGKNPGLSLRPQGSVYGFIMGGNYEASLVLIDGLRDRALKQHTPNGVVITVPARDICAFCDARSTEGITALKQIAERITKTGDHTLSDKLFIRSSGQWQQFDG